MTLLQPIHPVLRCGCYLTDLNSAKPFMKERKVVHLVIRPRNVLNSKTFDMIRLRNPSMSFWSHVSLFHTLRDFPPKFLELKFNSWLLSSVCSSSSRTLPHA